MVDKRTVVLIGNTLGLASIGAALGKQDGLRVEHLKAHPANSARRLQTLNPDVILFDLAAIRPELILSLLQDCPFVRLIGVDLAGGRLLVFSGVEFKGLALPDLQQAVWGNPSSENPVSDLSNQIIDGSNLWNSGGRDE